MATIYQTESGAWLADVRKKGVKRQTARFDTQQEAIDWADALEARIEQARRTGRIMPTEVSLAVAFSVWLQDIKDWIAQHAGEPAATKLQRQERDNQSGANYWSASQWADKPLRDLNQLDIENMIDERRREGRKESTIVNNLSYLEKLYEHAKAGSLPDGPTGWRWTISSPIKAAKADRKVGKSNKRSRRLNLDEHAAIQSVFARMAIERELSIKSGKKALKIKPTKTGPVISIRSSDRLLFIEAAYLSAIETAMRQEKLFLMTWRWVDTSSPVGEWNIMIPPEHQGPSNKEAPAAVPVSPRLKTILQELRGDLPRIGKALDEPVFGGLDGEYAYKLLQKTCDALGITNFNWHDLRHEACTRLAVRGWDIAEIQQVSGHKSIEQLIQYIHLNKSDIHKKFKLELQMQALESNSKQLRIA